jgi:hypothetical protein
MDHCRNHKNLDYLHGENQAIRVVIVEIIMAGALSLRSGSECWQVSPLATCIGDHGSDHEK